MDGEWKERILDMGVKKYVLLLMCVMMSIFGGCLQKTESEMPQVTGQFSFAVLQVGKADAIVLKTQNHSVVIDCGEKADGEKVAEYLADNGISAVDYLFVTHFDKDHVGGFPKVAEQTELRNIVVPNYEGTNKEYEKYKKTAEERNLNVTVLREGMSFVLDDVLFEVSAAKQAAYKEADNDFSIVISVTHGENTFLFAGDAEEERLQEVMEDCTHPYDFLKVPHHGKYNKTTEAFLAKIKPTYAVICDSDKNPADEETVSALEKNGSAVYHTSGGTVSVFSDGREIRITQ